MKYRCCYQKKYKIETPNEISEFFLEITIIKSRNYLIYIVDLSKKRIRDF